jgi:hypothetical protein
MAEDEELLEDEEIEVGDDAGLDDDDDGLLAEASDE